LESIIECIRTIRTVLLETRAAKSINCGITMWNNWVEKAKNVAANLDKQINESVGIEDDGVPATTISATDEENVWNDDFGDDQGFDDDHEVRKAPSAGQTSGPEQPEPAPTLSPPQATPAVVSVPPVSPLPSSEIPSEEAFPTNNNASQGWRMGNDDFDDMDVSNEEHVDLQQPSQASHHSSPTPSAAETTKGSALLAASSMLSSFSASAAPMSSYLSSTTAAAAAKAGPMSSLLRSTAAAVATSAASIAINHKQHEPAETDAHESALEDEDKEEVSVPDADGWDGDDMDIEGVESPVKQAEEPVVVFEEIEEEEIVERQTDLSTAPVETPVAIFPEILDTSEPLKPATTPIAPIPTVPPVTTQISVNIEDDPRYKKLLEQLHLRENQLTSKSEQLTELQTLWENQEQELRQRIQDTKDEAKKRITKARERCEAAEAKLQHQSSATTESGAQSGQLIAALRAEGENLARKQSEMERALRGAKTESRDLREAFEGETRAKEQALETIAKLEVDLKETKENLSSARRGESQVGKLENDLLSARSDADLKAANIMSLEQQVKELKAEAKELKEGIMSAKKGAEQDAERESKKWRREHNDAIADLELKLRTSEREAGVREDALRHEVSELRRRWQDAVRRADGTFLSGTIWSDWCYPPFSSSHVFAIVIFDPEALSMDVQSSTAPLLRQLESMERQNRARAAAWAELETKLRSELEETVIQNETMSSERSEYMTKYNRLERGAKDRDVELKDCRSTIDAQTAKLKKLEALLADMEEDAKKRLEEYTRVERFANEGVARVRSEMTQTVVDSEERYRGQIEKLEGELRLEKEKRRQLEKQVGQLLDNAGMMMAPQASHAFRRESKPKNLRETEGQAEILAGALGFDDSDDEDDEDSSNDISRSQSNEEKDDRPRGGMNSFAALEQLSSRLKIAKVELEALRANLRETEASRDSLLTELTESRIAKEKLPLFEAKVKELAEDNREKQLEIEGLRYDIAEVRDLYRTQLNILLEEKAATATSGVMNGGSSGTHDSPPKPAQEDSDPADEFPIEMDNGVVEGTPVEAS
jgi:TATA element modulatory factor